MSAALSRSGVDIAAVAQAALAACPGLLHRWFPHGKLQGHEFCIGNLRGDPGKSLRINTRTGQWSDFNGPEKGGDLVSLHAARTGQRNQRDAALELAAELDLAIAPKAAVIPLRQRKDRAAAQDDWHPMTPPPATAPAPSGRHFKLGDAAHVAEVHDTDGTLLHLICRYETTDGGKQVWPLTYGTHKGKLGWHWKAPAKPRPLYGLPDLAALPDAPVLLVEGEKKRDAAKRLVGGEVAVLSWPNGVEGVPNADWSPLQGRKAIVWPDADEGGAKAARAVVRALEGIAASACIAPITEGKTGGWDLADAEVEGWSRAEVLERMARAVAPDAVGTEKTKGRTGSGLSGLAAELNALDGYELNEDGIALAFAARFKDDLRYCHHSGAWFQCDKGIWRREETKLAFSWARSICRDLARDSESERVKTVLARASTAAAVERFAQSDRAFAVTSAVWDSDPWLLGTPGGTVDLRTGVLRPSRPEDYITKTAAVAPAATAECPRWLRFMDEVTGGDAGLVRFLQQWSGYCLTGDTREEALLFVHGPGGNGKGKFLNTLQGILGEYCRTAAMETFTASQGDKHPTDLAMLRGARMVCASETEEGRAWAEVRIKQMTGNDVITARFMRQDFFEYRPQFKLTIIGNHKPVLKNVDDAARRRFNIVPFNFKPEKPDQELEAKLRQEWPGVLRWMIEGCLDWQRNGLVRPNKVRDATAAYFEAQDLLAQWIAERCEVTPIGKAASSALYRDWSLWTRAQGEEPGTNKSFSAAMERRFEKGRANTGVMFSGIKLRPSDTGVC